MADLDKKKIIVVCGPTASGKTGLALDLCRRYNAELVSADSMQIYKNLVVGTAAVTPQEAAGIPVHLTGFLEPAARFSVADYVKEAERSIWEILSRNCNVVVCGGTGLYINSLVNGISFTEEKPDISARIALEKEYEALGGEAMLQKLARLDPDYAARLHSNDAKRIVRGLEQVLLTGKTERERKLLSLPAEKPYDSLCIGLTYLERAELYAAINLRVDKMMKRGLLAEAKMVYTHREDYKTAVQAIGYKEFFPYFEGTGSIECCVEALKQATRNYAKRQLTWFNRIPEIHWLNAGEEQSRAEARNLVDEFLNRRMS